MELRHIGGRRGQGAPVRPGFAAAAPIAGAATIALAALAAPGCTSGGAGVQSPCPPGQTCDVRLTLLHTADIHSRIFPYDLQILQVDSQLGLGTLDQVKTVGGVARVSYLLNRERARADRVLHVDSGDIFEGAPVFNFFHGEPETRASSMMGTDVMVIGNHEFDLGAVNAVRQMRTWSSFPLLAANYRFTTPPDAPANTGLDTVLQPFAVFDLEGLKVGVIGMANFSSLASVFDQPNSIGVQPLDTVETAQAYVDLLRPIVDVVVVLSHLGLDVDERMVQNTTGIDVVEGGHNHIVINPPQVLQDCSSDPTHPGYVWSVGPGAVDPDHPVFDPADTDHLHPNQTRRACHPRRVTISHSGAFAKYVGRLDLVLSNDPAAASPTGAPADYDPVDGFEVVSSSYVPYPVDDSLPEDPRIVDLLQPYQRTLDRVADLSILAGFSPNGANRTAPQGGDSPLGNVIADAMWLRLGVQTDFSLTNSTGIRADLIPGPVTIEEMFNIFPFDNTITKMQLSGLEVEEMFDFVARRSEGRGCTSQAQIAGARVILNCAGCNRPGAARPCAVDADCIGGEPGTCDLTHPSGGEAGTCIVTACADAIYIGHESNACAKDADCPDGLPGQCDLAGGTLSTGLCSAPLVLENVYDFATSNYLAAGGSGFRVLQRNTTQIDTRIEQRDALVDYMRNGHPCGYDAANGTSEGLRSCGSDAECADLGSFVCACPGQVTAAGTATAETCVTSGSCDPGVGRCVRRDCRDQVATFHEKTCLASPQLDVCRTDEQPCSLAGEECKLLACVDDTLGASTDNRIEMVGR